LEAWVHFLRWLHKGDPHMINKNQGLELLRKTPREVSSRLGFRKPIAICGAWAFALMACWLWLASRGQAQSESVIYTFHRGSDGFGPEIGLIADPAGSLYGATRFGGDGCAAKLGCGVVFELSPSGGGGWKQTVLYRFVGAPDAANPLAAPLVRDISGNLYGVAESGGAFDAGAIFKLAASGEGWSESIVYSFTPDQRPAAELTIDAAGNLYGLRSAGAGAGDLYELSPASDGWKMQVIDHAAAGGLVVDGAGNVYGTTASSVVRLSRGSDGWTRTEIHRFVGSPSDGSMPSGRLALDQVGNIYGTTYYGGATNLGTVYRLNASESGGWNEELLHSFAGGSEDANPAAGVSLDSLGNIFGTTSGVGTVFELPARAKGGYGLAKLGSLESQNGQNRFSLPVLDAAGNLFGTVASSGTSAAVAVYEVVGASAKPNGRNERCGTRTSLSASPSPSFVGQQVDFTATLNAPNFCDGVPTGVCFGPIDLYEGNTLIGSGSLGSACTVLFQISSLTGGTHEIKARYTGWNPYWRPSTSQAVKQVVQYEPTATTVVPSTASATYGQPVTFTATVAITAQEIVSGPTGHVKFLWGSEIIGTAQVVNNYDFTGTAILTKNSLDAGTYPVTAVYGGDSYNATSTSLPESEVVNQATSTATITSSVNPSSVGQTVTFLAEITSPTVMVKGPVTFMAGGTALATVELHNGKASFSTSELPQGSTVVTVKFAGDSNIMPSAASVTQVVP
jgi:uncharacterized repeat protein (TIGR03803 family)